VKRGEHGCSVVYASTFSRTERDSSTGEETERKIPFLKSYTVFNVEQTEGLPANRFCCINFPQARSDNLRAESGRQRIELLRGGRLAFLEHVHELDACQRAPSRPAGLESEHGSDDPLHRAMVLLY